MNKSELIEKVSTALETTKAEAAKAVNAMLSSITSTLKKGQKVSRRVRRLQLPALAPSVL